MWVVNIQIGLDWVGSAKMDPCPTLHPDPHTDTKSSQEADGVWPPSVDNDIFQSISIILHRVPIKNQPLWRFTITDLSFFFTTTTTTKNLNFPKDMQYFPAHLQFCCYTTLWNAKLFITTCVRMKLCRKVGTPKNVANQDNLSSLVQNYR